MDRTAEKWRKQVDPHFGFLVDRGFSTVDTKDGSFWSLWVQYRSATAAVRVSHDNETRSCQVDLIRLVDGEVPQYPMWITSDRIDWVRLDDVLEVRAPQLMSQRTSGLRRREVETQLGFWSHVLRDHAADFLAGSFAPIDEAGALIHARAAASPQELRVWLPADASAHAEADAAARAREGLPPEVSVRVHRYRPGGPTSRR